MMQDEAIVELYWQRDERAINETEMKYGKYLLKIAENILLNREDSQECVNDTYLKAWNLMPPNRPGVLSVFLKRITRFVSIDKFRRRNTSRQKASEYTIALEELRECEYAEDSMDAHVDQMYVTECIRRYLNTLPMEKKNIFVGRYFYMDSVKDIAGKMHLSESNVKVQLYRMRQDLKAYLMKEGGIEL